jgi:hypothetical protein
VEFESTIPASDRAKTFHALDHAATVIGLGHECGVNILLLTADGGVRNFKDADLYSVYGIKRQKVACSPRIRHEGQRKIEVSVKKICLV